MEPSDSRRRSKKQRVVPAARLDGKVGGGKGSRQQKALKGGRLPQRTDDGGRQSSVRRSIRLVSSRGQASGAQRKGVDRHPSNESETETDDSDLVSVSTPPMQRLEHHPNNESETETEDSDFVKPVNVKRGGKQGKQNDGISSHETRKHGTTPPMQVDHDRKGKGKRVENEGEGAKTVKRKPLSVRSRCGPKKISDILRLPTTTEEKMTSVCELGFGGPTLVEINSMNEDFIKWAIACYDVDNKTFRFVVDKPLEVTAADVTRVYRLPKGDKDVSKQIRGYKATMLSDMARANGLVIPKKACENVPQKKIFGRLCVEPDVLVWRRMMILYTFGVLLRPPSHLTASLKYLPLLTDGCVANWKRYNWCEHVVEHFHE